MIGGKMSPIDAVADQIRELIRLTRVPAHTDLGLAWRLAIETLRKCHLTEEKAQELAREFAHIPKLLRTTGRNTAVAEMASQLLESLKRRRIMEEQVPVGTHSE